jgi:beta-galactosidase
MPPLNESDYCWAHDPEHQEEAAAARRAGGQVKKKHGTLDALNASWYRQYVSWDEVEPNRLSTILSYTDYIDWKRFIADKLGEDLRARYQAAKRGAPDRVATSHAAGVGLFSSPHYWEGQSDDWTMAAQVDHYGTSFYPKHSAFVDRDVEWRGALLDFARSFGFARGGRGFWIGELQAGFGTIALNVSPSVTPADLRIWTWSALARGAKAIATYAYYPMSTGYESGGFGLIHLDGRLTELLAERHRPRGVGGPVWVRHAPPLRLELRGSAPVREGQQRPGQGGAGRLDGLRHLRLPDGPSLHGDPG